MTVKCINTNFPQIASTGKKNPGEQALCYPKLNEVLDVDEILGDFYRFEKYDSIDSFNWWHKSRFIEIEKTENQKVNKTEIPCKS